MDRKSPKYGKMGHERRFKVMAFKTPGPGEY
jgi:hypothetical protein